MRMLSMMFAAFAAAALPAQVFQNATPGLFQQTQTESAFLAALTTAPQLLTFEELPLGAVGGAQYASLGLTMNTTAPVPPLNTGDGALTVGPTGAQSSAHSGTKSLFAGPQNTAENYTFVFNPPVTAVSFWVIDQEVNQSAFDRIKLYDPNGALLLDVSNLTNGYTTVELGAHGNMFFGYIATGAAVGSVRIIEKLTDNDGIGIDDLRFVAPAAPTYPGTGDGLTLATAIGAAPPTVAPFDVKTAAVGDTVLLRTTALAAGFYGASLVVAAEIFATGATPPSAASLGQPAIHLSIAGTTYLLGAPGSLFVPYLTTPSSDLGLITPPGLAGLSLMVQSFVITVGATNGVYAASDAHEIRFL